MIDYNAHIKALKEKWVGRKITYEGKYFNVVDVDHNGMLLIDRKTEFADTTAIEAYKVPWIQRY